MDSRCNYFHQTYVAVVVVGDVVTTVTVSVATVAGAVVVLVFLTVTVLTG